MSEVLFYISLSVISFIGGMIFGMGIISQTGKIAIRKVQKERLEETIEEANKSCYDCKWYGISTCECPYHCTSEDKKHWELADNLKGENNE